jgi:hypothetical protein
MNSLVIGVDFNGVISDQGIKARAIKARTGVDIPLTRFGLKEEMLDHYGDFGLTRQGYEQSMKDVFENPLRFRELAELVPEAKTALCRLSEAGCELHVVSTCRGLDSAWTKTFLAEQGIPITDFVSVLKGKSGIYEACDVVIDDEAKHFHRAFLDENPHVTPILMLPTPGGTGCHVMQQPPDLDARIRVAKGWSEVFAHLPELQALAA